MNLKFKWLFEAYPPTININKEKNSDERYFRTYNMLTNRKHKRINNNNMTIQSDMISTLLQQDKTRQYNIT